MRNVAQDRKGTHKASKQPSCDWKSLESKHVQPENSQTGKVRERHESVIGRAQMMKDLLHD